MPVGGMREWPPIKILCTLGPASLAADVMRQMEDLGVSIFRINMSHTSVEELDVLIPQIQGATDVPICIDTEGAQIRTGPLNGGTAVLKKGDTITLLREATDGTATAFTLRPPEVFESLEPGTLLSVDFNAVLLLVVENNGDHALARVLSGGHFGSNKGVAADREVTLPPLTAKDLQAIQVALAKGIDLFALSFASDELTVSGLRQLVGPNATVISKVETLQALERLDGIIKASDAILIDRGDLLREISVEDLPFVQKRIIARAHQKPVPVYVATNLLESMVASPRPMRAEVSDIGSTLFDGANGLVLAAETAIGQYPVRCVAMVRRLIDRYLATSWQHVDPGPALTRPALNRNGMTPGAITLHDRDGTGPSIRPGSTSLVADQRPRLKVDPATVRDAEQIAIGTYSPLTGFMGRDDINSVLDDYSLLDGTVWTLPVILQVASHKFKFAIGDDLVLVCSCCDLAVSSLKVKDVYIFDQDDIARRWFGSADRRHPGVARLAQRGDCFIGGEVTLLNRHSHTQLEYCLTPAQVRTIFDNNAWDRVVGFHTRNTPHRAHEYIMLEAMRRVGADALLIHPGLGQKQPGDFSQEAILKGYEALINTDFPSEGTLLNGFFGNSWYAGPREAVFTAICRKNFGCSHFVVGRDHTGVGDFYKPTDVETLFDKLGDIGIEPVFFDEVVFDPKENCYREVGPAQDKSGLSRISGTAIRNHIVNGESPPEWMMRPEVSQALLGIISEGRRVLEP